MKTYITQFSPQYDERGKIGSSDGDWVRSSIAGIVLSGLSKGEMVGLYVGSIVGSIVGSVGSVVGSIVGSVGSVVGSIVGSIVGLSGGNGLELFEGDMVGDLAGG